MSPLPGATSRYPSLLFAAREAIAAKVGAGTAAATSRRLRRLGTRLPEAEWLAMVDALLSLVELSSGTPEELDEQIRDFLVRLGSDDPETGRGEGP